MQVFELLLAQTLPDFGYENWKSTIREQVLTHPDYHSMGPWNGVESADIVYHDREGRLGDHLLVYQ